MEGEFQNKVSNRGPSEKVRFERVMQSRGVEGKIFNARIRKYIWVLGERLPMLSLTKQTSERSSSEEQYEQII